MFQTRGAQIENHFIPHRLQVFLYIFAPLSRLLVEADRRNVHLKLDADRLRDADVKRNQSLQKRGLQFNVTGKVPLKPEDLSIPKDKAGSCSRSLDPYSFIFAPYNSGDPKVEKLYEVSRETGCVLSNSEALYLLLHIIEAPTSEGGAGWNLERLVVSKESRVERFFPTKFGDSYAELGKSWYKLCAWPWSAPFDDICKVMGSEVALYFAFIAFLSNMLVWPSILGTAVFVVQAATDSWTSLDWLPVVGIGVAVWCVTLTELWKRHQSAYALRWGTLHFASTQVLRAEFMASKEVKRHRSLATGKPVFWASPAMQTMKSGVSAAAVTLSAAAVVAIVLSIFMTRAALTRAEEKGQVPHQYSQYSGTIVNALAIQVAAALYRKAAMWLTEWENHPTDTAFIDSLIVKRTVFDAVNNFMPLLYVIAKAIYPFELLGEKQVCAVSMFTNKPDCLYELQYSVAIIFITRLVVGNAQELLVPALMRAVKALFRKCCSKAKSDIKRAEDGKLMGIVSAVETDADLDDSELLEEHLEVLITFAFAALFTTAFPLAPLLAMLSFALETKVDTYKLLYTMVRPMPRKATSIDSWLSCYQVVGVCSVVTNLLIVCFVGEEFFGIQSGMARFGAFVGLQYALFLSMHCIQSMVPDEPGWVALQKERMQYLVGKHIDGVPDEIISLAAMDAQNDEDSGVLDGVTASGMGAQAPQLPPGPGRDNDAESDSESVLASGYSTPVHPSGEKLSTLREAAEKAAREFAVAPGYSTMSASPDIWSPRHASAMSADMSEMHFDDEASVVTGASAGIRHGISLRSLNAAHASAGLAPVQVAGSRGMVHSHTAGARLYGSTGGNGSIHLGDVGASAAGDASTPLLALPAADSKRWA